MRFNFLVTLICICASSYLLAAFKFQSQNPLNSNLHRYANLDSNKNKTEKSYTLFDTVESFSSIYPAPPFVFDLFFIAEGVDREYRMRESVLVQIEKVSKMSHVPYIWGGNNLGPEKNCKQCRRCILRSNAKVKEREQSCPICRKCGIDCSHLVTKIFNQAGFQFPYGTTKDFLYQSAFKLDEIYNLIDLGNDPTRVQPGDLLLYRKHIVMVTDVMDGGFANILHSTALDPKGFGGGIRTEAKISMSTFRGKLKKVLRHKNLHPKPQKLDKT